MPLYPPQKTRRNMQSDEDRMRLEAGRMLYEQQGVKKPPPVPTNNPGTTLGAGAQPPQQTSALRAQQARPRAQPQAQMGPTGYGSGGMFQGGQQGGMGGLAGAPRMGFTPQGAQMPQGPMNPFQGGDPRMVSNAHAEALQSIQNPDFSGVPDRRSTNQLVDEAIRDLLEGPRSTEEEEALLREQMAAAEGQNRADKTARMGAMGMGVSGLDVAMGSDIRRQAAMELMDQILGVRGDARDEWHRNVSTGINAQYGGRAQDRADEQMRLDDEHRQAYLDLLMEMTKEGETPPELPADDGFSPDDLLPPGARQPPPTRINPGWEEMSTSEAQAAGYVYSETLPDGSELWVDPNTGEKVKVKPGGDPFMADESASQGAQLED